MKFVKGVEKLAFYGVPGTDGGYTFHRMKGFDELSKSLNPNEYSRKYVDEEYERTEITRYSPSFSFSLDQIREDAVHEDIVELAANEIVGSEAVRPIIVVDVGTTETVNAVKRDFSVIVEGEDPGEDLYKYNGTLRVNGDKIFGTATSDDEWQTLEFVEA